jgi:XTP/dITP diphosphohydrolase
LSDPKPTGAELLEAVAVMDRLRSPGGCPWDAAQTHDSLRRYLVEECYELLDALDSGSREHVVEELGDVLLQVLFHARIAAESGAEGFDVESFDIDTVAAGLVAKLVHRHPHVFTDGEVVVADAAEQELRWDELKAVEKRRESCVDGVATAQPALALAAKLASRATRAGVPAELLPPELAAVDGDAEDTLRRAALGFAAQVREAEKSALQAGIGEMDDNTWRRYWPV